MSADCTQTGRILLGDLDLPLMRPRTIAALAKLVLEAVQTQTAIYPVGGQTRSTLGRVPEKPGTAVDMTALDAVIDYPVADMTITVQTGITVGKLSRILAEKGQRLPVDSIDPEKETIGGMIATNASGPRRLGHGTLRDYILGIKYLTDEGDEAKAGGRVVKNVAGYDLCKLQTGALGTLGILTEATLKLRPLNESSAIVFLRCFATNLEAAAEALHNSKTRPVSIDVLNPRAMIALASRGIANPDSLHTERGGWILAVGFEDNSLATQWQVETLCKEISIWNPVVMESGQENSFWQGLTSLGHPFKDQDSPEPLPKYATIKATGRASEIAWILTQANEIAKEGLVTGHLQNGVARIHLPEETPLASAVELAEKLLGFALKRGGNLILESGPVAWRRNIPVWGEPRPDQEIARRIHRQMDPSGTFNPGRFLPGI